LTGKKSSPGSIASMSGGTLSEQQGKAILSALSGGPKFPSDIVVDDVSQYSPHGQQGVAQFLQPSEKAGRVKFGKTVELNGGRKQATREGGRRRMNPDQPGQSPNPPPPVRKRSDVFLELQKRFDRADRRKRP
jgi:hypothetical protein